MWEKPTPPTRKTPRRAAAKMETAREVVICAAPRLAPSFVVGTLVIRSPFRPPPEGVAQVTSPAGLLARGSSPTLGLPGVFRRQWPTEGGSPPTVAGAAAAQGATLSRVPFFRPAPRGNRRRLRL